MRTHHLRVDDARLADGRVDLGCTLEAHGGKRYEFTFVLPEHLANSVSASADAYVLISLFTAVRLGGELRVHGEMSPQLFRSLKEFIRAWCSWAPRDYQPLSIEPAELKLPTPVSGRHVLMPFSGGLDSCHSLWMNLHHPDPPLGVASISAVMVHGFDIPLDDESGYQAAYKKASAILESVDVPALTMKTNVREHRGDWENEHGAALAASLHLLSAQFNEGLIAGSHSYDTLRFPWGSNPLTDPLLSSESMPIRYDGLSYRRNDKARDVSNWPAAMEHLRTCWKNADHANNCGKCMRCIGTALCFASEEVTPPVALNVGPLSDAVRSLAEIKWEAAAARRLEDSILAPARANGIREPWVSELARLLEERQGKRRGLWGRLKGCLGLG